MIFEDLNIKKNLSNTLNMDKICTDDNEMEKKTKPLPGIPVIFLWGKKREKHLS